MNLKIIQIYLVTQLLIAFIKCQSDPKLSLETVNLPRDLTIEEIGPKSGVLKSESGYGYDYQEDSNPVGFGIYENDGDDSPSYDWIDPNGRPGYDEDNWPPRPPKIENVYQRPSINSVNGELEEDIIPTLPNNVIDPNDEYTEMTTKKKKRRLKTTIPTTHHDNPIVDDNTENDSKLPDQLDPSEPEDNSNFPIVTLVSTTGPERVKNSSRHKPMRPRPIIHKVPIFPNPPPAEDRVPHISSDLTGNITISSIDSNKTSGEISQSSLENKPIQNHTTPDSVKTGSGISSSGGNMAIQLNQTTGTSDPNILVVHLKPSPIPLFTPLFTTMTTSQKTQSTKKHAVNRKPTKRIVVEKPDNWKPVEVSKFEVPEMRPIATSPTMRPDLSSGVSTKVIRKRRTRSTTSIATSLDTTKSDISNIRITETKQDKNPIKVTRKVRRRTTPTISNSTMPDDSPTRANKTGRPLKRVTTQNKQTSTTEMNNPTVNDNKATKIKKIRRTKNTLQSTTGSQPTSTAMTTRSTNSKKIRRKSTKTSEEPKKSTEPLTTITTVRPKKKRTRKPISTITITSSPSPTSTKTSGSRRTVRKSLKSSTAPVTTSSSEQTSRSSRRRSTTTTPSHNIQSTIPQTTPKRRRVKTKATTTNTTGSHQTTSTLSMSSTQKKQRSKTTTKPLETVRTTQSSSTKKRKFRKGSTKPMVENQTTVSEKKPLITTTTRKKKTETPANEQAMTSKKPRKRRTKSPTGLTKDTTTQLTTPQITSSTVKKTKLRTTKDNSKHFDVK